MSPEASEWYRKTYSMVGSPVMKQYTSTPQHTVSATAETSDAMRPPHASVSATPPATAPSAPRLRAVPPRS